MAHDAARGHLFGLWVTDPLDGGGVRLEGDRLALLPGAQELNR